MTPSVTVPAPAPATAPSPVPATRKTISRWFATAMEKLRFRRRRRTAPPTALPPPPRSSGVCSPKDSLLPPPPTRRPPPPPPDSVRRPRPPTVALQDIAAGRRLVSWLPPGQRLCRLCLKPFDGANTDLERRTPWAEREIAVRVAGCLKKKTPHVVGRRCLDRWAVLGSSRTCPLCALEPAALDG